ncbi:MAG: sugar ABC transporter ATP-binding protein [Thermomicrobiales bacterium]
MSSVSPLLVAEAITRRFPGVTAVDEVDFAVRAGEVHALLGENGAGKSTLIKILGGALRKDGGTIRLNGAPVDFHSPAEALAAGIAVIYQELVLCPHLSVAENVLMGHLPRAAGLAVDWPAANRRVADLLGQLGVSLPLHAPVGRLSTAQQQLVEIAKALSRDSRILVLDEPSAALGQRDLEHLFRVIRLLREQGAAIVYISHRLEEVFEIADRVTVLKDGRLVGHWPVGEVTMQRLVRAMTGRDLGAVGGTEGNSTAPVRLAVRGLGRLGAFQDVSLSLRAGEIVGIAGLVGSGRTELLRAIFGADQPDSGEVEVDGVRVRFRSPAQALRRGLGLLPEDRKTQGLLLDRALRENVSLASLRRVTRFGFLRPAQEERAVRGLMADLQIVARGPGQPVDTLSGGNQQKVVLARWLARQCGILLFDEPTRGVDVGAKEEIYRLIHALAADGAAVLVVSSELKELFAICPRILVMREGRLVGEFAGSDVREEDVVDAMLMGGRSDGTPAVTIG